jgi:hypothetical protein
MGQLLAISIDVTKLDKSKFIAGKKGTYANLTISVNDTDDQFGNNVSIWEGQSQEEREAKADRNFLGNGKVVWTGGDKGSQSSTPAPKKQAALVDDDLPF